jgi:hypothetical protein
MTDEEEFKLPRFSADLIDFLDEQTQLPDFPTTVNQWGNLNPATTQQLAFKSGYRKCVDDLVEWLRETNEIENIDDNNDNESNETIYDKEFGRVLDDSREKHPKVAPVHMDGVFAENVFRDYSDPSE